MIAEQKRRNAWLRSESSTELPLNTRFVMQISLVSVYWLILLNSNVTGFSGKIPMSDVTLNVTE